MHRVLAIIERDIRKFMRSPTLILVSMFFPLVQLVILGYAFGGKIQNLEVGVVDQDRALESVKLREMFGAIAANARTFVTVDYTDPNRALTDLRNGKINAVLNIPPGFSRRVLSKDVPEVALIEDNTDNFAVGALQAAFADLLAAFGKGGVQPRIGAAATLSVVEIYPYVPYIQYLLPGTIVLAIFVAAMIGGGIIYIDDKARGLHEGYLVTPITKFELILGFNLSGALKAVLAGLVLATLGSVIAGVPNPMDPGRLIKLFLVIVATALALISMMFMMMVRVSDPLVPRATFGVLNTLLYFPSGAVYPVYGFPKWMRVLSSVDPFTYAVQAFKDLLLKNTPLTAIAGDLAFLCLFTAVMLFLSTALFRRTL
ncbi:MAG TPA: ABC transporter permease [Candidatus Methylomirabilis sp.]|nr:ABC transporter permease [Candidatus Methylomirabilis sp.]